ncbi:hypothetical protein [Haloterrigena sp. H1]|nr:hypothetical protein [Haloterrigena sp. H1]
MTRFADATAGTLPVVSTDVGVVSNWGRTSVRRSVFATDRG